MKDRFTFVVLFGIVSRTISDGRHANKNKKEVLGELYANVTQQH